MFSLASVTGNEVTEMVSSEAQFAVFPARNSSGTAAARALAQAAAFSHRGPSELRQHGIRAPVARPTLLPARPQRTRRRGDERLRFDRRARRQRKACSTTAREPNPREPPPEVLFERMHAGDDAPGRDRGDVPAACQAPRPALRPLLRAARGSGAGRLPRLGEGDRTLRPGPRPEFASFAIPTILGELRRYFRDATWAVHVPRGAQERAFAIEAAEEQLRADQRTAPTVEQIAEYLRISDGGGAGRAAGREGLRGRLAGRADAAPPTTRAARRSSRSAGKTRPTS